MKHMEWDWSPEETEQVDALLLDIAIAERELEERERYGMDIPEDEETIDLDIHDNGIVITRRRWDGGTV